MFQITIASITYAWGNHVYPVTYGVYSVGDTHMILDLDANAEFYADSVPNADLLSNRITTQHGTISIWALHDGEMTTFRATSDTLSAPWMPVVVLSAIDADTACYADILVCGYIARFIITRDN